MSAVGQVASQSATRKSPAGRTIVLEQELRALWLGGRGLVLCFAFSLLMSAIAYLVATNTDLNFLEQRESVNVALQAAIAVGTLVAVFLTSLGLLVSCFAASNRVSLSLSLFVLLALVAPTQLPAGAQQAWAGDLLLRVNPLTAGERYISKIVVNGHPWSEDISWLLSPVLGAVVFAVAAILIGGRYIRLRGGVSR